MNAEEIKCLVNYSPTIRVKRKYVDITGDIVCGVFLASVVELTVKSKEEWIQKKREDWREECGISAKQFDRASDKLKQLGLIDVEKFNIQGRLRKCIKLNIEVLIKLMQ